MKKILSAVAALGLVAGVASTASALEFNVSGYYFVEGVHLSAGDGSGVVTDNETGNDSYWRHEFVIKPTMTVNDKIVVKSKIYLAANEWGATDLATADGGNVDVYHMFMEYMSPVGKIRAGRTSAGMWQGDFMSNDSHANRLMFFPNFMPENVGACVFTQKSIETDGGDTDVDTDSDVYEASVWYKTKDMVVALGYDYFRDATDAGTAATTVVTPIGPIVTPAVPGSIVTKHRIKGYYNQTFTDMYAEVEFQYDDGETDEDSGTDSDLTTLAVMADVGMKCDKLDIGMMFIYGSGDDDATDNDTENVGQLGEQFQPYNVLTGATTGMMSNDFSGTDSDMTTAGIISLGLHADYAVSDVLSLNSAIVYAEAADARTGVDDEYGWEVDLGVAYKLMNNLTYQVDFGYLAAGDFFEDVKGEDDSIYTLTHRLTMEF